MFIEMIYYILFTLPAQKIANFLHLLVEKYKTDILKVNKRNTWT